MLGSGEPLREHQLRLVRHGGGQHPRHLLCRPWQVLQALWNQPTLWVLESSLGWQSMFSPHRWLSACKLEIPFYFLNFLKHPTSRAVVPLLVRSTGWIATKDLNLVMPTLRMTVSIRERGLVSLTHTIWRPSFTAFTSQSVQCVSLLNLLISEVTLQYCCLWLWSILGVGSNSPFIWSDQIFPTAILFPCRRRRAGSWRRGELWRVPSVGWALDGRRCSVLPLQLHLWGVSPLSDSACWV